MKQSPAGKYEWAGHLDWMEGMPETLPTTPRQTASDRKGLVRLLPGLAVAAALAGLAYVLSTAPVWPFTTGTGRHPLDAVMLAVVLGMILGNIVKLPAVCRDGVAMTVTKALPLGVVLLGARLDFVEFVALGSTGVLLSCVQVVAALVLFLGLIHWLKIPQRQGLLLGVGTAICGGTAIVAVAPVVQAEENEIALSVASVTLIGLVAMFMLPIIGSMAELDPRTFGIWAGLTVHQTPQVIAAGFAHSPEAGETATIIKLARVCLLAPVVVLAGLWWHRGKSRSGGRLLPWWRMFPLFVLGFAGMALLRTLGLLPHLNLFWPGSRLLPASQIDLPTHQVFGVISAALLTMAMAGVGLQTRFATFRRSSLSAIWAAGIAAVLLGGFALTAALAVS